MSRIAIIPARGGSVRIPRKNIRHFHGKPIIAYSIETAQASGLFDEIVVSTDDDDIETIARICHASIHRRQKDDGSKGTQEVTADVLRAVTSIGWGPFEYACCIYATSPLMLKSDLIEGFRVMVDEAADDGMTYSVGPDLSDAGQWYWGRVENFLRVDNPHDCGAIVVIPENRVCDINTEADWLRAERMYADLLHNDMLNQRGNM